VAVLDQVRRDGVRLPLPITDPAWFESRRGKPSPNSGMIGADMSARPLTESEVVALLRACSPRTPSGKRNRALLELLWRGGVRIGEAVGRDFRPRQPDGTQVAVRRYPGLFARDIDIASGLVRITYGKGDKAHAYKPRTIAIDPGACAMIQVWLDERRRLGIPPTVQLFCTISADEHRYGRQWRPLQGVYVRNLCKRLARVAEIDARVHPHGLRHTMAFEMAMEGQPINLIQQQLGHSSLATTGRYIQHIAPQLLAQVVATRTRPDGLELHGIDRGGHVDSEAA
jgi:integrase